MHQNILFFSYYGAGRSSYDARKHVTWFTKMQHNSFHVMNRELKLRELHSTRITSESKVTTEKTSHSQ